MSGAIAISLKNGIDLERILVSTFVCTIICFALAFIVIKEIEITDEQMTVRKFIGKKEVKINDITNIKYSKDIFNISTIKGKPFKIQSQHIKKRDFKKFLKCIEQLNNTTNMVSILNK